MLEQLAPAVLIDVQSDAAYANDSLKTIGFIQNKCLGKFNSETTKVNTEFRYAP